MKGKRKRKAEGEEHVVKEERGRWAEGRSGQRGTEEKEEEKGEKRESEREKKRAHGHRKSGALHSHAKSSDGVFTPRRCRNQTHPAPFKSLLPTISSCSHVG